MKRQSKRDSGPVRVPVEGDFLRLHQPSGQGYVLVGGRDSEPRRRIYVGPFMDPTGKGIDPNALQAAAQLILDDRDGSLMLQAKSSRASGRPRRVQADGPTVGELAESFLAHLEKLRGKESSKMPHARTTARLLTELAGTVPGIDFGPNRLRAFQRHLGEMRNADRSHFTRGSVNEHVQRVVQLVEWAVSRELLPSHRLVALKTVRALTRGEIDGLRESQPVQAVEPEDVAAVLPFLSPQLRAVVRLLAYTGARPSEVLNLRPCDVDSSDPERWVAVPASHKNAWREEGSRRAGYVRTLVLSLQARKVLEPFLRDRLPTAYLFSPREAEQERRAALRARRKTPAGLGNGPKPDASTAHLRAAYCSDSLRRAIARACEKAGVPTWTPYQLRHLAVTVAEQKLDEMHAGAFAGHKDETVTRRYHEGRQKAERARTASEAVGEVLGETLGEVG